ncbi:zinc-dependent metalloprotease [Viridibacterium curvum]|uniref:Zinc-dependent metalloprotease n=1 Tax=Viridibacterium curvum TaxID=1101404 RepID=A0ABP9R6W2_9RHOO
MQTDRKVIVLAHALSALLASALLIACSTTDTPAPAAQANRQPVAASAPLAAQAAASSPVAASAPAAGSAPAAASAPAARPPSNPNLKPFAELTRDFKRLEGFLNVWVKDGRYLVELGEKDFDKPFFFMSHRSQGLGERRLWPGLLLDNSIGVFRQIPGDRVQWVERNSRFIAPGNKVMERNIAQGFSESTIGTFTVLSLPHPTSKAVLIDISQVLLNDIAAGGMQLEYAFRLPYAQDRNNSLITEARSNKDETTFEVRLQFLLARSLVQQPGQPPLSLPTTVPDPRSLTLGFHYSFSALPDAMRPRVADPRVGYFMESIADYRDELSTRDAEHYIARWRLEKQSEAAAESEPKQPITFWLDRNIPERYRDTVREGVLMWNAAFERIGFKNAIVVKQQADDASFDTMDRQHASIRWYLAKDGDVSIGPTARDPRTGEILDADVLISDSFARGARQTIRNDITPAVPSPSGLHNHEACDYADALGEQLKDTIDHLVARGEMPADPEAIETYVRDYLRQLVAHEVGHALGLSHNFIASSAYTIAQLRDPDFVAKFGTSASVMDYIPSNIGLAGEKAVPYFPKVIGPYDFWAIEYGYTPLAIADEAAGLKRIASKAASDRNLAYANDLDADLGGTGSGLDPEVNRFDLGSDSQAWFERRVKIIRERIDWVAKRSPDDWDYSLARETIERSLRGLGATAGTLGKKIGGVRTTRNPSTRVASYTPVPTDEQRRALNSLTQALFQADSLQLPAGLLQRLPPDHLERWAGMGGGASFLPLANLIFDTQSAVLRQLTSDATLVRLVNIELLRTPGQPTLSIADLLGTLQGAIWSELDKPGQNIALTRRNLQRQWTTQLATWTARLGTTVPDMRSLVRVECLKLRTQLQKALKAKNYDLETRAHLEETLSMINEALEAKLLKLG